MANKAKRVLYNMSRYVKAYVKGGEVEGYMLSMYATTDDGTKVYKNAYVRKADGISVTTGKDGNPVLHLKLAGVDTVDKDKPKTAKEEDGDDFG